MAQFNIDASLSNGKRLEWLAFADEGEEVVDAVRAVKRAAARKFGDSVLRMRWLHKVASNGCIRIEMHA